MTIDFKKTKGLFFDIYATLINWEAGIYPRLLKLAATDDTPELKTKLLNSYHDHQKELWAAQPTLRFPQVLEQVYARIAKDLDVKFTQENQQEFGRSIGDWPAFPDTVQALGRLAKHYKLFVLSNVDNDSFDRTRLGPLQGAHWDGIYTAEMIGSYKPDPKNYQYLVDKASEDFSIKKDELIMVAQSLDIDHLMLKKLEFAPGVWITRGGSALGGHREEMEADGLISLGASYETLADFADVVEAALGN